MFDHINSHYHSTELITFMDTEMLELPETLPEPEFISCNSAAELKMEPELEIENNESFCEVNKTTQLEPSNESGVLNIKSEVLSDSEDLDLGGQVSQTDTSRSPNKFQLECGTDPKNSLALSKDLHQPTPLCSQIQSTNVADVSNVRLPILRVVQTNSSRLKDKYQLIYNDAAKIRPKILNGKLPVLRKILPNPAEISDDYQLKHETDLKRFSTLSKDLRKPTTPSNELKLIKPKTTVPTRDLYELTYNDVSSCVSEISNAKLSDDLSKPKQTKVKCSDCDLKPPVTNECDPRRHECTYCKLWFSNHFNYRTHFEEKHEKRCYQCEMEPPVTNESDPRRHKCLLCQQWFMNHIEFKVHFKDAHDKDADEFFSTLSNCFEFSCYYCEKTFSRLHFLSKHMEVHRGKFLQHQCPHCGKTQKTYGALTQHMKTHEGITYKCKVCDKEFPYYAKLLKHLWCHKTELNYVCEICSKAFKMQKYLSRHMAVHDVAKISCRFCDASFKFSSGRRIHEKSFHYVV